MAQTARVFQSHCCARQLRVRIRWSGRRASEITTAVLANDSLRLDQLCTIWTLSRLPPLPLFNLATT